MESVPAAVNERGHMIDDQQLMDGDSPSRPLYVEGPCAVEISVHQTRLIEKASSPLGNLFHHRELSCAALWYSP